VGNLSRYDCAFRDEVNVDDGDHRSHAVSGGVDRQQIPALWMPGIPAVVDRLFGVRQRLTQWSSAAGLSEELVNDVGLAAYEAMANVVDHAYPDGNGDFDLHAVGDHDLVTVTITDRGCWKPPLTTPSPSSLRGRGLVIMEKLSSQFELAPLDSGTTVRMTWSIS
jgi:anti-sigma regulatory factor (Ser/Thr protein kinase)